MNTVELMDQLLECRNKIALATMAIDGWDRQGSAPKHGISALSLMMDDIVHEIEDAVETLKNHGKLSVEQATKESKAA
ncbi:hypothetical protein [Hyphomonas sp.]|uniref:hypothetical protein n=1 Tax=Hyphomonas sp. TaxID=87 RepID=UPI0025BF23B7|nr:hypothetical protein [Hyphomonas sp.]